MNEPLNWPDGLRADFTNVEATGRDAWEATPPTGRRLMLRAGADLMLQVGLDPSDWTAAKGFALGIACGPALQNEGLAPFVVAALLAAANDWPMGDEPTNGHG